MTGDVLVENLRLQCAALDAALTDAEASRDARMRERDECRKLLRKIFESPVIGMPLEHGQYDYTRKVVVIEDDVLTAARDAAGGGNDE